METTRITVEWLDHEWNLDRAWHDADVAIEDAKKPTNICRAVGLLVAETDETLTITATENDHEKGPCFTMLKRCILRRQDDKWPWSASDGQ